MNINNNNREDDIKKDDIEIDNVGPWQWHIQAVWEYTDLSIQADQCFHNASVNSSNHFEMT